MLADFDSEMPSGREQVGDFLALMAKIVRDEKLPHLDRGGMAALVEEAVRLARNRRRISARFSDVADILREAAFLARRASGSRPSATSTSAPRCGRGATATPCPRRSSPSTCSTTCSSSRPTERPVGQVNGLAVYDLGYHAFGLPGRVTARVALGREGVINIEREARHVRAAPTTRAC